MKLYPSNSGEAAFARLAKGGDLLRELTRAANEVGIEAGTVQVIGAVTRLNLGYYDQERREYDTLRFAEHLEIASGLGNVSLRDGEPFVHLHVVASRANGSTIGGHLMEGSTVFAAEAYFRTLDGPAPVREMDEETGLHLWR